MIKKSDIQTLILTKEREFKHRAVSFLNNIAFNSEKISRENVSEGIATLNHNPKLLNLVIDGENFFGLITQEMESLVQICSKPDIMVLFYVNDKQFSEIKEKIDIKNLCIRKLPFEKNHFNEAFHNRGGANPASAGSGVFPSAPKIVTSAAKQPNKSKEDVAKKNITAFETSGHLRETIAMINIIDKNRSAVDQVVKVGQIFNGVVGAFAYFANKPGFSELKNLAIIIDDVSRFYIKESKEKIADNHFELLFRAAKASFQILQKLRDDKEVSKELLKEAHDINDFYMKIDDIVKREQFDQNEIDKMLENM